MKEPQTYLGESLDELIESLDMKMDDKHCPTIQRVIDLLETVKVCPADLENKSAEEIAIYFKDALQ